MTHAQLLICLRKSPTVETKALKMTHAHIDEALLLTVEDAFHHLEILLPRAFSSAMAP